MAYTDFAALRGRKLRAGGVPLDWRSQERFLAGNAANSVLLVAAGGAFSWADAGGSVLASSSPTSCTLSHDPQACSCFLAAISSADSPAVRQPPVQDTRPECRPS